MADHTVSMVPAHPGARSKPNWAATQVVLLHHQNPDMSHAEIAQVLTEQYGQRTDEKGVRGYLEAFDRWARTCTEGVARKAAHREREARRQADLAERRDNGERVLGEVRGAPSAPENRAQSSPRAIV